MNDIIPEGMKNLKAKRLLIGSYMHTWEKFSQMVPEHIIDIEKDTKTNTQNSCEYIPGLYVILKDGSLKQADIVTKKTVTVNEEDLYRSTDGETIGDWYKRNRSDDIIGLILIEKIKECSIRESESECIEGARIIISIPLIDENWESFVFENLVSAVKTKNED